MTASPSGIDPNMLAQALQEVSDRLNNLESVSGKHEALAQHYLNNEPNNNEGKALPESHEPEEEFPYSQHWDKGMKEANIPEASLLKASKFLGSHARKGLIAVMGETNAPSEEDLSVNAVKQIVKAAAQNNQNPVKAVYDYAVSMGYTPEQSADTADKAVKAVENEGVSDTPIPKKEQVKRSKTVETSGAPKEKSLDDYSGEELSDLYHNDRDKYLKLLSEAK